MNKSIALLVFSLAIAAGGWIITLPDWSAATTTVAIGGLLMNLGGVGAAWLGKSPLKPKQ